MGPGADVGRARYHIPIPHRPELSPSCATLLRLLLITQALNVSLWHMGTCFLK